MEGGIYFICGFQLISRTAQFLVSFAMVKVARATLSKDISIDSFQRNYAFKMLGLTFPCTVLLNAHTLPLSCVSFAYS